jgi:hypothetical protein
MTSLMLTVSPSTCSRNSDRRSRISVLTIGYPSQSRPDIKIIAVTTMALITALPINAFGATGAAPKQFPPLQRRQPSKDNLRLVSIHVASRAPTSTDHLARKHRNSDTYFTNLADVRFAPKNIENCAASKISLLMLTTAASLSDASMCSEMDHDRGSSRLNNSLIARRSAIQFFRS